MSKGGVTLHNISRSTLPYLIEPDSNSAAGVIGFPSSPAAVR